jgi:hypothetical protein
MRSNLLCKGRLFTGVLFCVLSATSSAQSDTNKTPPALLALTRLLPGWSFGGDLDVGFSMPLRLNSGGADGQLRLSFQGARFSNPDENLLGDNLKGVFRIGGARLSKDEISIRAALSISGGEVLMDRYYAAIGPKPFRVELEGIWNNGEKTLREMRGTLDCADLGNASWEGLLVFQGAKPTGKIRAVLNLPSHQALFNLLMVQPLAENEPEWEQASMSGSSRIRIEIELQRRGILLNGRLAMKETGLVLPFKGIQAQNVSADIPFSLPIGDINSKQLENQRMIGQGEIRIEEIEIIKGIRWKDLRIGFETRPNAADLNHPLTLPLFGGRLIMDHLRLRGLVPFPPNVIMGLKLEGLDLQEISKTFTPYRLEGAVQGDFPRIEVERGDLRSEGDLTIDLWGGQVIQKGLWGEQLFSKRRRVGFDIDFRGLNMEQATGRLPFGRMGGILGGAIKGLVLSFGQPESFELEVHSVASKGVKQYVDAKAVENLSILSGGVRAPLPPWFKIYPYSELGIYCKLENDIFTLRGTVVEGGQEYLLKRGFLRGINVINRNPRNQITWKDMVRRLGGIIPKEGQKIRVEMGR